MLSILHSFKQGLFSTISAFHSLSIRQMVSVKLRKMVGMI